jgi:hypothetical protein
MKHLQLSNAYYTESLQLNIDPKALRIAQAALIQITYLLNPPNP